MRFRQSYAKKLLYGCPGELKQELADPARPSNAMSRGSVVDQLVFGNAAYHVIQAKYKSGARKGEPVSSWTPEAKAEHDEHSDTVCIFTRDEPRLKAAAQRVRRELLERGIDLESAETFTQQHVTWIGRDGVPCEGTPDIVCRREQVTVDLKYGEECDPRALRRLIWNMCWDVQGAAYQEAYGFNGGTHCIARASDSCFVMVTLSPLFLSIGAERLDYARAKWRKCITEDSWPWWEDCTVEPPEYELQRWMALAGERR